MGERLEVSKSLIEPVYWQSGPGELIDLGEVAVRFALDGHALDAVVRVVTRFVPENRLLFIMQPKRESERPPMPVADMLEAAFGGMSAKGNRAKRPMTVAQIKAAVAHGLWLNDKWDGKFLLKQTGVTVDAFCVKSGGDGTMEFIPRRHPLTVTPPRSRIARATFHLFNFPKVYGPDFYILNYGTKRNQGSKVCGRIVLRTCGWVITMAATDKTDDVCKALDAQGGYAITHVGEIKREDGATFSTEKLEELLFCLRAFLSFGMGRWVGLAFPVGFDEKDQKVYEQWGLPRTVPGAWKGTRSWFDEMHSELLSETFPGFLTLWEDSRWHTPVWKAIYWYLLANESNADAGLILAQTALELLAWRYCVEDRKMVSADAFEPRGLSAADKLRLLASALKIPLEIPVSLSALHAKPGKKWLDAPDAITGTRNVLVHPHAKVSVPDGAYYEAANLSLWYLEMILLCLSGHRGKYSNRLALRPRYTGCVESVPWAKDRPEK